MSTLSDANDFEGCDLEGESGKVRDFDLVISPLSGILNEQPTMAMCDARSL